MNLNGIKQIGIVGGGQGALMLCIEAAKMGIRTSLLDPKVNAVGAQIASEHIICAITNESIQKLSLRCDVVVFNTKPDFEINVKLHSKTYPPKENLKELYHYKNVLEILEVLEIPTMKTYYQDNQKLTFGEIEKLEFPFRFVKQYRDRTELMDVYNKEDLTDFILEVDDTAESFLLQPLSTYEKVIHYLCIVDEQGKIICYDPIEEYDEEDRLCRLNMVSTLSKSMQQRLTRYNRKLLKEIQAVGAFTIKYGVKANKSVELIDITPQLSMAALLTPEAYELSVYEQYMHLILGLKLTKPELEAYVHGTVRETKEQPAEDEVCHFYRFGLNNLCIVREKRNEL